MKKSKVKLGIKNSDYDKWHRNYILQHKIEFSKQKVKLNNWEWSIFIKVSVTFPDKEYIFIKIK